MLGAFFLCHAENTNVTDDPLLPDIQKIKDRGRLIVAQFKGERPLFFMRISEKTKVPDKDTWVFRLPDNQLIGGYDIRLAMFLAQRLNVGLEFKRIYETYDDVVKAVARGDADIGISKLNPTYSRLQRVRFSRPYQVFSQALLVNRNYILNNDITVETLNSADDHAQAFNKAEMRLGVQANSSLYDFAELAYPKAHIVKFPSTADAVLAVKNDKVDAVLSDDFEFMSLTLWDPEISVYATVVRIPDSQYKICMAVPEGSSGLLGMADELADSIKGHQTAAVAIKKYGRILKNITADIYNDPDYKGERPYPYSGAGKKQRMEYQDSLAVLSLGAGFAILIFAWFCMSGRRKSRGN